MTSAYDVLIVGGAVHGASVAYHLAADPAFDGRVLLIEKDPTFQFAATSLSAGSIRQQFSTPTNIAISLFGIDFLRAVGERLEVDGERPDIGLREGGYLFLATNERAATLARNHALQTDMGADILHLDPAGLRARFPYLATDGYRCRRVGTERRRLVRRLHVDAGAAAQGAGARRRGA